MDKKLITILLSVVLIIPLFVAIMSNLEMFTFAPGDVGHWIGFWGSYLGAIIGMIAIFITTQITIKNSENQTNKKLEIEREEEIFWRMLNVLQKHQENYDYKIKEALSKLEEEFLKRKLDLFLRNCEEDRRNEIVEELYNHQKHLAKQIVDYLENSIEGIKEVFSNKDIIYELKHLSSINGLTIEDLLRGTSYLKDYKNLVWEGGYSYCAEIQESPRDCYELDLLYSYNNLPIVKDELKSIENQDFVKEEINAICREWVSNNNFLSQRLRIMKYLEEHTEDIDSEKLALCFVSHQSLMSREVMRLKWQNDGRL